MYPVPPVSSGNAQTPRKGARRSDKPAFEQELENVPTEETVGLPASLPRVSLQLQEMLSEVEKDKPSAKQILVDEHRMDRRLSSRRTSNRKSGRRASDRAQT